MVKYAEKKDKSRIKECFQSIPRQLAKENKKFQYSVVRKGSTAAKYAGSLQWIEDAGIISRCYNLSITELPLDGNAEEDTFKVYMRDMGLFVSMLEDGTQYDILQGNLFGYKGAIFENLIADIFTKMGRKLYYFHKDSGLEVDFVIRYKGECTLVEVKAATGNIKSTKTILNHPEKYHVSSAIKLGDYNVGRMGASSDASIVYGISAEGTVITFFSFNLILADFRKNCLSRRDSYYSNRIHLYIFHRKRVRANSNFLTKAHSPILATYNRIDLQIKQSTPMQITT